MCVYILAGVRCRQTCVFLFRAHENEPRGL